MLEIDGSYGEGGGQLLRLAVALSAITDIPIHIVNIRARRKNPGLAPQHLVCVYAVGKLCDAKIEGLALRSQAITFVPQQKPQGGHYHFNIGTAGSITLVLQALLPVMLSGNMPCSVHITGGTDVRQAPPVDYLKHVLLRLIKRLGARVEIQTLRRGYYPQGGGEVRVTVTPAKLKPATYTSTKGLKTVSGIIHVTHLPEHIAQRMKQAVLEQIGMDDMQTNIETQILVQETAYGSGGAVVYWIVNGNTVFGAARVAERGVPSEILGRAVGKELAAELAAGAALDTHAADQILIYLALGKGGSFTTRSISSHAQTAMWLIVQFLPVTFSIKESAALFHISVSLCKNRT
ncbi:MAG: RNA 3'-terminal phosphate cyclase [Burkholderiales bacterium]|nr:RNA 3'-terminal phosphate cyclase [Nitrosomonas sp.]MCP5276553.1 RNA 3'-terminal phosphate cyclase [Burkholderiales bacterium]